MLPTCDRGRVNGYAKNHHGNANGVNDGGRATPNDAVIEKRGNENVSAASASVVAAKVKKVHELILEWKGLGNTRRCVARGPQVPSDHHRHRPHACFEL